MKYLDLGGGFGDREPGDREPGGLTGVVDPAGVHGGPGGVWPTLVG
ncbi:hypothetical protein [Streptomyces sp. cf386]|nr:hypothetical protein [Streptomyces sp. cf386]